MVVIEIYYYAFDQNLILTFTFHSEKQRDENECQLYARHRITLHTKQNASK